MRHRLAIPAVLLLAVSLVGCNKSSTSDTLVEADLSNQPQPEADPAIGDALQSAARQKCAATQQVNGRPVKVVTTVSPITNIVGSLASGTNISVTGLVPEGTNSHTFEPPPSAAATLEEADIIFVNGLGLEDPTLDLAKKNAKPSATICEVSTAVLAGANYIYDFSFPLAGGKPNPHIWTNPPMVLEMISVIRGVLSLADPTQNDTYDKNYVALSQAVTALDDAMKVATETIQASDRQLLTYHDSFAYFASHFNYEVIGAVQPQSFEEPSPKEIADLINQVKEKNVKAIFGSEVFPSPVMKQIGEETGARYVDVLRDDDLPGKPGEPEHSWLGLMKFDYITIVEALGGDAKAVKAVKTNWGLTDKAYYPQ